jgi:hypothetical protein
MKVQDQDKSNCDLACLTSLWRENKLVQPQKEKKLKGDLMVLRSWGPRLLISLFNKIK